MKKLKVLSKGDTIGIISVSSPVEKEVVDKTVKYFEDLGYKTKLGKNILASNGYMAGSIEQRVFDLHSMFKDPTVNAIICAWGGTSANQLLQYINYGLISNNPKIFVGLSDPSVLSLAISTKSKIPTFHGPTGYNFGATNLTPYTEKYFFKALSRIEPIGLIEELSKREIIKEGTVEGEIIGGNLTLLQTIIGTPYEPDWNNKILFWEDLFVELHTIDLILTQFDNAGIFAKIKGMVIGKLVECNEEEYTINESFSELIERLTKRYNFPILYNVDLGHSDDKITIPIGVKCKMVLEDKTIQLEIIESPFSV